MRSYVFTILDDTCAINGKDSNATELLSVMRHYGKVESYEANTAAIKASYESSIANLTAEYNRIKQYDLTEDEKSILSTYRACKESTTSVLNSEIERHKAIATNLESEHTAYVEKIKGLLTSLTEQA